jgi:hypothetical protein
MLSKQASSWRPGAGGDYLVLSSFPIGKAIADNFNSTGTAAIQSQGLATRSAAETSGIQKPLTSAAPASQPQKIKNMLGIRISLTPSGRNGVLIGYRTTMTMFGSSISEAGRSIVRSNGKTLSASTVKSTVHPFGLRNRMKKHNQKPALQDKRDRAPERALSRVVEGKKRHRRHGKRGLR